MATIVEVLADALSAKLSRPENAEAVRRFGTAYSRLQDQMRESLEAIARKLNEIVKSPPSEGYEPFFVAKGYSPLASRVLARILVRRGRRVAFEDRRRTHVLEAIRFLSKRDRKRSAVVARAKTLIAAWNETSIIETIFDEHHLANEQEFVALLKCAANGRAFDSDHLTQIAASVAAVAKTRRGPKVTAASAAHEMFVSEFARPDGATAYTWNPYTAKFTDPATMATRLEFKEEDFDPRPAYGRAKGPRVRRRAGDRAS